MPASPPSAFCPPFSVRLSLHSHRFPLPLFCTLGAPRVAASTAFKSTPCSGARAGKSLATHCPPSPHVCPALQVRQGFSYSGFSYSRLIYSGFGYSVRGRCWWGWRASAAVPQLYRWLDFIGGSAPPIRGLACGGGGRPCLPRRQGAARFEVWTGRGV